MAQSTRDGLRPTLHQARQLNALLPAVTTPWVVRLADDDTLVRDYFARMMPAAEEADVLYAWDIDGNKPHIDCSGWSQSQLLRRLDEANWIDGTATLVRTDWLRSIGGWPVRYEDNFFWTDTGDERLAPHEDWACWQLLARAGARFRCLPVATWKVGTDAPGRQTTAWAEPASATERH
jgi:hypothetical protein